MPNKYRVDRALPKRVPCGMNSLMYLSDNWQEACSAYDMTQPGLDTWGQPNDTYGVILSVWDDVARDYVVKRWKGLD